MGQTSIEWTDITWNPPIYGCTRISPACHFCYAMRMAHRQVAMGHYPSGITHKTTQGVVWTNAVKVGTVAEVAASAARHLPKKKRARVFVMSMADLFHRDVPFEIVDAVFAEMATRQHLTFQVLTKRPGRALEWWRRSVDLWHGAALSESPVPEWCAGWSSGLVWPRNIWIGCTVEDQQRADERIPPLLHLPAPVRFLSMEPLLGPVDLRIERCLKCDGTGDGAGEVPTECTNCDGAGSWVMGPDGVHSLPLSLDWIITGGESGPKARPSHPDWFRDLRDQCQEAGVPFHFKQWGSWVPRTPGAGIFDTMAAHNRDRLVDLEGSVHCTQEVAGHGAAPMSRVGKKAAGRMLDGRTWDESPPPFDLSLYQGGKHDN